MKLSLFFFFIIILTFRPQAWGKNIKHPQFNFPISAHKIKMGEIHYSFVSLNKDIFLKEAGPFLTMVNDLRSAPSDGKYVLFRAVFPINKAIGHFDSEVFNNLSFIKKLDRNLNIIKVKDNTFLSQINKPTQFQFFSKFHFDSDDLSSLPDSRIGGIISELKSSDPLLQSANATVFREMFGYKNYLRESSEFYGLISLNETKSLVVYMRMMIFSSDDVLDYVIERDLTEKAKGTKSAFEGN